MPEELRSATPDERRRRLRADCARCVGLCCVVPAFAASSDFAIDKDGGKPCPNLRTDFRCGIHEQLRDKGFPGCTVYDCFGAGQQVTQVSFGGGDWRRTPAIAGRMFEVFPIMRQLHELLWYLSEALTLDAARGLHGELGAAVDETERLTRGEPDDLVALNVGKHRRGIANLLRRTSALVRAEVGRSTPDHAGADLIGKGFRGADLRGADLRGAFLIAADLRGADLRGADLLGTDLRGANLAGADLVGAIFLTQPQLEAARGDVATRPPAQLTRPRHWAGSGDACSRGGRSGPTNSMT
ncbi:pentapeptide repeat-containing protein [Actinopolymorpha sp. B9G3]|uniref:pentapeptide repeat-containing protein n=1 Tax=Actinopolymorpha sp. B9G3 TaxID=3158970 RepID=UPI0032D93084